MQIPKISVKQAVSKTC